MGMSKQGAKELQQTMLWGEFCEEIDDRIEATYREMRTCTPDNLAKFQHRITNLEECRRIPQDVVDRES